MLNCVTYKMLHYRYILRCYSNYQAFSFDLCNHTCTCQHTRANLSAHAICFTHEKSYSAENVLFHRIFFFQSFVFVYECHLWIMRYMSTAYHRRCSYDDLNATQNGRSVLSGFFLSVFSFVFFRTAQVYTVYIYTILNVKFLPFV